MGSDECIRRGLRLGGRDASATPVMELDSSRLKELHELAYLSLGILFESSWGESGGRGRDVVSGLCLTEGSRQHQVLKNSQQNLQNLNRRFKGKIEVTYAALSTK